MGDASPGKMQERSWVCAVSSGVWKSFLSPLLASPQPLSLPLLVTVIATVWALSVAHSAAATLTQRGANARLLINSRD